MKTIPGSQGGGFQENSIAGVKFSKNVKVYKRQRACRPNNRKTNQQFAANPRTIDVGLSL
jgi:hypothetical protein